MKKKSILFIGLGLISGSLFKTIVKHNLFKQIYVCDLDPSIKEKIFKYKNVFYVSNFKDLIDNVDLICLGLYPLQNVALIENNLEYFNKKNVFDISGLQNIWNVAVLKKNRINYVASHPMCGKEVSGFDNSDVDLIKNARVVINKVFSSDDFYYLIHELYQKIGAIVIDNVSLQEHDKIVTYTSQLPHVISLAYTNCIKQEECEKITTVSSNSFNEFSRISNVNIELWSSLFLDNSHELTQQVDELIASLVEINSLIKLNDVSNIKFYMEKSKININLVNKSLKNLTKNVD